MSTVVTFSIIAALSTVVAGSLPILRKSISERGLSLLIAFSAGVLLAVGFTEMIPESFELVGRNALIAASAGFLALYLLEKITLIHVCREQDCEVHEFGRFALIGIGFHSMVDGFAIAVSGEIDIALGLLVALAVLIHRIPDGISISAVMLAQGYSRRKSWALLALISSLAVIGAVLGLGLASITSAGESILGIVLGISAGTFIYVSTNDLLPEAHRNYADYAVPATFILGFSGFFGAGFFLPHV